MWTAEKGDDREGMETEVLLSHDGLMRGGREK